MPESIVSMFRCARRIPATMIAHDVAAANRLHELPTVAARNEREQRQRVPALNNRNTEGIEQAAEAGRLHVLHQRKHKDATQQVGFTVVVDDRCGNGMGRGDSLGHVAGALLRQFCIAIFGGLGMF